MMLTGDDKPDFLRPVPPHLRFPGHGDLMTNLRRHYPMLRMQTMKRLYWAEKRNRKRAKELGVEVEVVDYIGICYRADFKCYYCGKPIKLNTRKGDPHRLSLEHIVSLRHGGGHVTDNVTCAHQSCNAFAEKTRKQGDPDIWRLEDQQRRLLERGQMAGLIWPRKELLKWR